MSVDEDNASSSSSFVDESTRKSESEAHFAALNGKDYVIGSGAGPCLIVHKGGVVCRYVKMSRSTHKDGGQLSLVPPNKTYKLCRHCVWEIDDYTRYGLNYEAPVQQPQPKPQPQQPLARDNVVNVMDKVLDARAKVDDQAKRNDTEVHKDKVKRKDKVDDHQVKRKDKVQPKDKGTPPKKRDRSPAEKSGVGLDDVDILRALLDRVAADDEDVLLDASREDCARVVGELRNLISHSRNNKRARKERNYDRQPLDELFSLQQIAKE